MAEAWQAALAVQLRQLRLARNLSVRELAERSRLSPRALATLEAGAGNPTLSSLHAVADALGVDVTTLIQRTAPRSIALLGLRGAGKSTVGAIAAAVLARPFVELDRVIEQRSGLSLRSMFELHGVEHVRRVEHAALQQLLRGEPAVVATGGGIVTNPDSFALLQSQTITVWLRAPPQAHWDRVRAQGDERPMENRTGARAELEALWQARAPLYAACHHTLDTEDTPTIIAERLAALTTPH
jgi:XRE family transcriptional regulator, aerobic/anaerobic benzoate catabolism transcriptional regulator